MIHTKILIIQNLPTMPPSSLSSPGFSVGYDFTYTLKLFLTLILFSLA